MPKNKKNQIFVFILLIIFVTILLQYNKNSMRKNESKIKGIFVFGGSLIDNGNNNFLDTSVKIKYSPYGIDFPFGASGRFTNGKTLIDLLCDKLHLPLIPPFSHPSTNGKKIINGVNYASGASGILNDTGSQFGHLMNLEEQMKNFEEVTLPELEGLVNNRRKEILKYYLFVVGTGWNDYKFNYIGKPFMANVTIEDFTSVIINLLSKQIEKLYNLGGRKFIFLSLNPIGCNPTYMEDDADTNNGCVKNLNELALIHNSQLKSLVDSMNELMLGSNTVYINTYKIIIDVIINAASLGFENRSDQCCETNYGSGCLRNGKVCKDRKRYVFFDGVHPTEAVNVIIMNKAFESNLLTEVYPMNIKQLTIK